MKNKKTWILKAVAALAVIVLIACTCRFTIIMDEQPVTIVDADGNTVVVEALSVAEQYCVDNWDSRIVPTIKERAVEVSKLIADVGVDLNAAGEAYGNRANETSAWSFCTSATATVLELENADKPNKTLLVLDLAPADGTPDCKLFWGKVFSSNIKNAIRDGVGFLKLDDFANQVEFADLTTAFNNRVKNDILSQTPAQELVGKELSFYGCISLTAAAYDNYVIIPVELTVTGG